MSQATGGSSQPPAQSKSKIVYEAKRTRKFQTSWQKMYTWLETRDDQTTMFCKICGEHPNLADKRSSFFQGTSSMRLGNITGHHDSIAHKKCVGKDKQQKVALPEGAMDIQIRKLNKRRRDQIERLFVTAYHVAKAELPFTNYTGLVKLQLKNGLELCGSYQSDKACRRFIDYIHDDVAEPILQKIKDANVMSIMFDGSTDNSVTEIELVYIRILDHGEPRNYYLGIAACEHAHADGIYAAIDGTIAKKIGIDWKAKTVGAGCDGASVNTGRNHSVSTLLLKEQPCIIVMHCVAHRLELAVVDTLKEKGVTVLKTAEELLKLLWKHYQFSPKALRELRAISVVMEEKVLKPVRAVGTRWTPHMRKALQILLKCYPVILAHFEHVASPDYRASDSVKGRAKKVSKELKDYEVVRGLHLVLDVLEVLSILSLRFQQDRVTLSGVLDAVETCNLSLIALSQQPGEQLQLFYDKCVDGHYCGSKLNKYDAADSGARFSEVTTQLTSTVRACINHRLQDLEVKPVLEAARILFQPKEWPTDRDQLAVFGNTYLTTLAQHFELMLRKLGCDEEQVKSMKHAEWPSFKQFASRNKETWTSAFDDQELHARFPTILKLAEIVLVIPMSTAICERGFSAMKRIKSDWRSSLGVEMLDRLMVIVLEGPSLEDYHPAGATSRWWKGGQRMRRPDFGEQMAALEEVWEKEEVTSDSETSSNTQQTAEDMSCSSSDE